MFGNITTEFHRMIGGFVQIKRKYEFVDGPYHGKVSRREIFLTPEEFEQLRNLDIDE